ncbi:DUF5808 domain-containing protein [Paenibacillus harenae]|uniref:Membrane protein n=1 Tax=Paenibacillus harenae TaxID=306543 RepID=A0ABT9U841_PAEHA|nr:DUF5808 domain-containing protein [Paenibacillus harenae]MDQ0115820.1 putative membrane protein [Paenibacillus harenae]
MDKFILFIPILITYIIVLLIYFGQNKPRGGILFGIGLPPEALNDKQLLDLKTLYNQSYTVYFAISLLAVFPLFGLTSFFSLSLIYTLMWLAVFLYTSRLPFIRVHHGAAMLKREKKWFIGEPRTVRIDDKINALQQATTLSAFWFAIPVAVALAFIILSIQQADMLLRMTGLASLGMTSILFVLSSAFTRMKPKYYSENKNVNDAINTIGRRYWSILWLAIAIFESGCAITGYLILSQGSSSTFVFWLIGVLLVSLVPLAGILFVHNKLAMLTYDIAHTDGQSVLTDDDQYWLNGSTYYNPNDQSVMVPKRVGIGTTLNMATRTGKWIQYGTIIVSLAIIIPLGAFAIKSDYMAPVLTIENNGRIAIDYSPNNIDFPLNDVVEITLEDNVPSGFRTSGMATAAYARGSFTLDSLGKTKLYIYKNKPPYIMIKLPYTYIVYNENDPAKTRELYASLLAANKQG